MFIIVLTIHEMDRMQSFHSVFCISSEDAKEHSNCLNTKTDGILYYFMGI